MFHVAKIAKKKENEHDKNLLSLGSLQVEVQKEEQKKKFLKVPIILIAIGVVLIFGGVFYKNIADFISSSAELFKKHENVKPAGQFLRCTQKKKDKEVGISRVLVTTYHFKKDLLKTVDLDYTYTPLPNSMDIATNNLSIYNEKYKKLEKSVESIDGLEFSTSYKENKMKIDIKIDYQKLDVSKVPKDNLINVSNKLDQTLREIKEIEGRAGHLCNTN